MSAIKPFRLIEGDEEKILKECSKSSKPFTVRRGMALLALAAGHSKALVAEECGYASTKSVRDLVNEYYQRGFNTIIPRMHFRYNEKGTPNIESRILHLLNQKPTNGDEKWDAKSIMKEINGSRSAVYCAIRNLVKNDPRAAKLINYNIKDDNHIDIEKPSGITFNPESLNPNSAALYMVYKDNDSDVTVKFMDLTELFSSNQSKSPENIKEYKEAISNFETQFRLLLNQFALDIMEFKSNTLFSLFGKYETKSINIECGFGRGKFSIPRKVAQDLNANARIWTYDLEYYLIAIVSMTSCRKTAWILNCILGRTEEQKFSPTTICIKKTQFGMMSLNKMNDIAEEQLNDVTFFTDGQVVLDDNLEENSTSNRDRSALTSQENIDETIKNFNMENSIENQIDPGVNHLDTLEKDPEHTNYVTGDVCYARHQKEQKNTPAEASEEAKYVQNPVGTLQQGISSDEDEQKGKKIFFNHESIYGVFLIIFAILFMTNCIGEDIVFFFDGELRIVEEFKKLFWWKHNVIIILDWFHITQIVNLYIGIALTNREKYKDIKDDIKKTILRLIWVGKIKECLEYLKSIDKKLIKNQDKLDNLIQYFIERQQYIVCYALRKQLGLPNSSNPAETASNILVANRQKKKGSSWSFDGSRGMSTICALRKNGQFRNFIEGNYSLPGV